ncbi:MAG: hypothetical protein KGR26_15070, partial [Cyanobacteria bacterium REEB65]|nr:hypothetical protein [Cyanobacteria bacterium REEB65]
MSTRNASILLAGTACLSVLAGCPAPGPGPAPTPIPIAIEGNGGNLSVGLNPTSAAPGTSILFGVQNATPSSTGAILWEGTRVATFSASVKGAATGNFVVPLGSTAATHGLAIQIGSLTEQATFDVMLAGAVSPGTGMPGTALTMSALNGVPGDGYTAYFDGQIVGTQIANGTGEADIGFSVPSTATSGDHPIRIVGAGHEFDGTFSVPNLALTAPSTTRWGSTFAVAVGRAMPGHTYQVFWDGSLDGSGVADAAGATTLTIAVPTTAEVGNHTLRVADETGNGLSGTATVNIPDTAQLTGMTSVNQDSWAYYQGSGWAPGETVT